MNLPPLSIPDFPLPFAVPHMIHPLFVHFAIALPVVIILFELVNLGTKRKAIGVMSFVMILLLVAAYAGAYLTGITDGKEAAKMMSPEAKDALAAHKQLGVYLVYGSLVVLLFKLISAAVNRFPARLIFLLILIGFTLTAFNEGKKGGELVYKYGANVQAAQHAGLKATPAAEPKAQETLPAKEMTETVKEKAKKSVEALKEKADKAATVTVEKAKETTEKVQDAVKSAGKKAEDTLKNATENMKGKATQTSEKVKETIQKAIEPSPQTPANPQPVTPVETVPAG